MWEFMYISYIQPLANHMFSKLLYLFCFLLGFYYSFAQTKEFVVGQLVDSQTGQPVVFATVRIKDKPLGVISNTEGDFKIPQKYKTENEILQISSMGYETLEISLSSFQEGVIKLLQMQPALFQLDEVTVSKRRRRDVDFGAREIVYKAIENLSNNVSLEPYSYVGYYRDYQLKNGDYNNLNEALLQVYDQGFNLSDYETTKIQIFDYQRNTDFPLDTIGLKPYDYQTKSKTISNATLSSYGGNEYVILRIHNPIRNFNINSFDFVNRFEDDFTRNHTFSKEEDVLVDAEYLYHIVFSSGGDKVEVKGDLYITQDNFAISGFHYRLYEKRSRRAEHDISLLFETNLEYLEHDSKMYLSYHSMNNTFRLATPPKLQLEDITLDLGRNQIILEFTNILDEDSALRQANYTVKFNGDRIKLKAVRVIGNEVSLIPDLTTKRNKELLRELKMLANSQKVNSENLVVDVRRIKDLDGNVVNESEYENRKQFREFFVQEIRSLGNVINDSLLMKKNRPLFEDQPILKPDNFKDYWMNTPLKSLED